MNRNKLRDTFAIASVIIILAMVVSLIIGILSSGVAYAAGDEIFAQNECIDCHYEDDFAGEAKEDIASWIKEIVDGAKHRVELNFTDEEIEQLAEYLSSFE